MTETDLHFDTQPKAVDAWLEALPIAHVGETARQLYMTLRNVNRRDDVPVKHHFHLLEGIAEPLDLILPELRRHYIGKPLPLSSKRKKVAELYIQLLRQSILGYQQVIAHAIDLNRFGWKKVVTTAVHRIFHYSALMLCNYRLLHLPHPKGHWQQIYWLFQLVEKYALLDSKVNGVSAQTSRTTLRCEFKKLLLHALLSPNLFKVTELQQVIDNMALWSEHIDVYKQIKHAPEQVYAFTLDTDLPPGLIASSMNHAHNPDIEVRYLDITPLLQFLNRALINTRAGVEEIRLTRHQHISRRALLILLNIWGRPASRDGERRLIQGQAEVAIGVSAIHYVISEGRHSTAAAPQQSNPTATKPASALSITQQLKLSVEASTQPFATQRDQDIDVWESAYFEPEAQPPSWTESIRMKVYSYLNAKVLNISKGGFCVALPQDGIEHIQTNEVVAIRGKKGEWQLGEIRWLLCPGSAPIRAGIQKLSQRVSPAQLHIRTGAPHSQPIKCLLGQRDNDRLLFLPNLPMTLDNKSLLLEINGEQRKLNLLEQLYLSPVGSAYRIELHKRDSAAKTSAATTSDYQSIWTSL